MGSAIIGLYNDFFRFPILLYRMPAWVALVGTSISLAACVAGAIGAVRRAVRLPPAEAMRPEAPQRFAASLLERAGLSHLLGPAARMVVRNIERQPVRAVISVVGIATSSALMVLGVFSLDAIDEMLRVQFDLVQRQDVTVALVEPRADAVLHELRRLPGVLSVEPTRAVAVRLRAAQHSRQLAISALPDEPLLQRVVDVSGRALRLPARGIVVSRALADALQVGAGEVLTIEVLEGRRPTLRVPIVSVVEEYLGLSAYMTQSALRALLMEGDVLSGAHLLIDPRDEAALYRRLKAMPAVGGVVLTRAVLESFNETMGETMGVMITFNVLFASIIAFGVVYNAARVSLSERARELASLRVLGFTRAEISAILLGELAALVAVAVPLGLVMGYGFASAVISLFETEMYRFPVVVSTRTYAAAATVTVTAALMSGLFVRRQLDHLDLVAVLKTRE
jgi:putative ABC transport system permease protein